MVKSGTAPPVQRLLAGEMLPWFPEAHCLPWQPVTTLHYPNLALTHSASMVLVTLEVVCTATDKKPNKYMRTW